MPWYTDLELKRHGAVYIEPELNVVLLTKDGRTLEWWTDFARTVDFLPNSAGVMRRHRVIHSRCLHARARGERGDADGFFFDRREPPGRQMVRSTSRPSAIPFYGSLVGADAGARAVGPSDDDDVGGAWSAAAAATTGPSNNDGQILQQ